MKESLFWKAMLILLVFSSMWDIYLAFTEPSILQPTHPLIVSVLTFFLDFVTIIACLGLILKKYILNQSFWGAVIFLQVINTIVVFYFEFSAGGYTINDMLLYGNIGFFVTLFFISPLIRYYYLIKKNIDISLTKS